MDFEITLKLFDLINILLFIGFIIFSYYYWGSSISNKIAKPYKWENAILNNEISKDLVSFEKSYYDKVRLYNIWFQIQRLNKENIKGAYAELGVYKGETAKIIHLSDPNRKLFLFDTFSGFDKNDLSIENNSDTKYNSKNFSDTNLDEVKTFINGNDNIEFIEGYFPESLKKHHDIKYAFIHLDADLYAPTLAALKYFYPRLENGGVIIIHDYNHDWNGNRKAVEEFMSTLNTPLIELTDWQGSALIIKS